MVTHLIPMVTVVLLISGYSFQNCSTRTPARTHLTLRGGCNRSRKRNDPNHQVTIAELTCLNPAYPDPSLVTSQACFQVAQKGSMQILYPMHYTCPADSDSHRALGTGSDPHSCRLSTRFPPLSLVRRLRCLPPHSAIGRIRTDFPCIGVY